MNETACSIPLLTKAGLASGLVLFFCLQVHAANVLTNPGFENDPPAQSQKIVAWTTFAQSSGNTLNESNPSIAHTGTNYFKVYQSFTSSVNYNGIYQDVLSGPGATYNAGAWAYTASSDAIAGQNIAWAEVSFRDAAGNILALYRSALISANSIAAGSFPHNKWTLLQVTNQYNPVTFAITNQTSLLVAPPNTAYARYQITFQGDASNSAGSMYFDDLSLNQTGGGAYGNWNITWSDEFNESTINPKIWTYDTGGGGWGNNELEYYTTSSQNSYLSNGVLHIVALQQSMNGSSYTSARMKSEGLYAKEYGRLEWRGKLPAGVGMWPALWLLGADFSSVGWPGCGEVDVVENNGTALTNVQGSLHSGSDETQTYTLPGGSVTNFHIYTLDWTTNAFSFYVDGLRYETQTNWSSSVGSYPIPFNQPFFFLMNLAVGGNYVGNPSASAINAGTTFPQELQVDYVRVYEVTGPLQLSASNLNGEVQIFRPTNIICHLQFAPTLSGSWTDLPASAPNPYRLAPAATTFYRLVSP